MRRILLLIGKLCLLSPVNHEAVDKMISTMLDEELMAKDKMMKETFDLFLERSCTVVARTNVYVL